MPLATLQRLARCAHPVRCFSASGGDVVDEMVSFARSQLRVRHPSRRSASVSEYPSAPAASRAPQGPFLLQDNREQATDVLKSGLQFMATGPDAGRWAVAVAAAALAAPQQHTPAEAVWLLRCLSHLTAPLHSCRLYLALAEVEAERSHWVRRAAALVPSMNAAMRCSGIRLPDLSTCPILPHPVCRARCATWPGGQPRARLTRPPPRPTTRWWPAKSSWRQSAWRLGARWRRAGTPTPSKPPKWCEGGWGGEGEAACAVGAVLQGIAEG